MPNSILEEASEVWQDLAADSTGIHCVDVVPIVCEIRQQFDTVEALAKALFVSPSQVRTTGVILALAAAAFHHATTDGLLPVMFASVTGAEETFVYGCSSGLAKRKGITCEPFTSGLVVCHGGRPHSENDFLGRQYQNFEFYTREWHQKTGTRIMNFLHDALRGDLRHLAIDLHCTKYLVKKAGLLKKNPEEIAASNKTLRASRVRGALESGALRKLASALRHVDVDDEHTGVAREVYRQAWQRGSRFPFDEHSE
jgi:hypothetical protein